MEVNVYRPYFDPNYDSLIDRIYPPRVCVDNDTCHDCTLVKVDSANKYGILLEMVQVLTDLDLVISKSYISSDGGWFMDVFHVTDQLGNKITDDNLILYIQQAICSKGSKQIKITTKCKEANNRPFHVSTSKHTAIEITAVDRPGMMSEISAVLSLHNRHVSASLAWTHHNRVACIIYIQEENENNEIGPTNRPIPKNGPDSGPTNRPTNRPDNEPDSGPEKGLSGPAQRVRAQIANVLEAHHRAGERWNVAVEGPAASRTHPERRLHQMMSADADDDDERKSGGEREKREGGTEVTIEHWKEKGYSVVSLTCRDRPKLLFDTVCALTDLHYVVFHAAISSKGSVAFQEYYIRHKDGEVMYSEKEKSRVTKRLVAATERRVSHGLRLDLCTRNRDGLLCDITRAFRENGLSITRAEIGTRGEKAMGSFCVTDASGEDVSRDRVEMVRQEIGGTVLAVNNSSGLDTPNSTTSSGRSSNVGGEDRPKVSLGTMLWTQLEKLSSNFKPIKS